jgi:hypothetical protein
LQDIDTTADKLAFDIADLIGKKAPIAFH